MMKWYWVYVSMYVVYWYAPLSAGLTVIRYAPLSAGLTVIRAYGVRLLVLTWLWCGYTVYYNDSFSTVSAALFNALF